MKHGVLPRFNLWTREAGSAFTEENQTAPPLEYLIEAQKAYTELRWKYGLDPPLAGIQGPHSWISLMKQITTVTMRMVILKLHMSEKGNFSELKKV